MRKFSLWRALGLAMLVGLAALMAAPVVFMLGGAFMSSGELSDNLGPVLGGNGGGFAHWTLLPREPTLRSEVELLLDSPEFFHMFWNSVKIAAGALLGQLAVGAPAAWGFARYRFPGRRVLFGLYVTLMLMPFQVTMLSSYLAIDRLGLRDSLWAVIMPSAFSTFPVYIMYRSFYTIPDAVIESAMLDARNGWQVFRYVGLPLGGPGVASAMVLGFLECWNLIEQPLAFLRDAVKWPLSLYLPNIGLVTAGPAFAGSLVALVPAVLVFLSGRDYLEAGIAAAAVKG